MNKDIKAMAVAEGVKLWQVADVIGMADTSLSRKLRHELSEAERAEIIRIIECLKEVQHNG